MELPPKSQIALLDAAGPFFYPQRLYMAMVLGAWMQILVTIIVTRVLQYVTEAMAPTAELQGMQLAMIAQPECGQDLLRAAIAGERFAEYFYANSQDEAISDYLRSL